MAFQSRMIATGVAPTLDLLSKIATAKLRSRGENHSATALLALVQLKPWSVPRRNRRVLNEATELAKRVRTPTIDHQMIAIDRPFRFLQSPERCRSQTTRTHRRVEGTKNMRQLALIQMEL